MRLDHLLSKELQQFWLSHAGRECRLGGLLMGGMLVQVLCLLFGVGGVLMGMCVIVGALLGFEVTSLCGVLLSGSRHESSSQTVLSGCA